MSELQATGDSGQGYRCPSCFGRTRVLDSRISVFDNGDPSLRRRRECEDCSQRVTTYEVLADKLGDIGGMDREKGDRVKALMRIKDIIDRMLKAEYPGSLDT